MYVRNGHRWGGDLDLPETAPRTSNVWYSTVSPVREEWAGLTRQHPALPRRTLPGESPLRGSPTGLPFPSLHEHSPLASPTYCTYMLSPVSPLQPGRPPPGWPHSSRLPSTRLGAPVQPTCGPRPPRDCVL